MVRVAVATPLRSVRAVVKNCGCWVRNPPTGVSKVTLTLRSGLPSLSRTTAVITADAGSASVTTTLDGLATATRSPTMPGRVTVRSEVMMPDTTCTWTSLPAWEEGKVRQVVALPGCATTGRPVCCEYWVTSQGGAALVTGKPTIPIRLDTSSSVVKGTTVNDTGVPFSTVLPCASVTMAVSV